MNDVQRFEKYFVPDPKQIVFTVATFVGIAFVLLLVNRNGNQPRLKVAFQRIHVMDKTMQEAFPGVIGLPSAEIGIIIVADVRNTGSPSMAECCDLIITLPGVADKIVPTRLAFPPSLNVQGADGKTIIGSYTSADALYEKLATRSLEDGDMVRGVLMYGVQNIDPHMLATPGTKYELHVKDVTGADSEGDWIWPANASPDVVGYLPGLTNGLTGASGICCGLGEKPVGSNLDHVPDRACHQAAHTEPNR